MKLGSLSIIALLCSAGLVQANCGGNFSGFVDGLKAEARSNGFSRSEANKFFATAAIDKKVLQLDRSQSVFRQNFTTFASRVVSKNRRDVAAAKRREFAKTFATAEARYGLPSSVLLAFWAMETDFGANQGNINTLNALVTLAHDCRRPELFRPQIFAAMELWKLGSFNPASTTGAWAGEIGMVQMLPDDILKKGVDGDGDGRVLLKTSADDAILTSARVLQDHGWKSGEPWMVEVNVPSKMDWAKTGLGKKQAVSKWASLGVKARGEMPKGSLKASLLLPEGHKGPAFLVFDNFDVYFEWNKSLVNVTSAAYFATRLAGQPAFDKGNPTPPLEDAQMKALQKKLQARGYNVGKIDGILGANTRAAVQAEQVRLKLPADAWPTKELLNRL